jgi:hypothetical protein
MRKITLAGAALLGAMLVLLPLGAFAQPFVRTWVASNGTNNSGCGRQGPCQTFQQAYAATAAGGEIHCVDAADYGGVTITMAISIICGDTQGGGFAISGTVVVDVGAGPNDIVTLKGLDIDGGGPGGIGGPGIIFSSGAALHIHRVHIKNYGSNNPNTAGILFQPSAYSELYVEDSYVTDNGGSGANSGGIVIQPSGSGSANVFINRVRLENNSTGILVDGSNSTGTAVNTVVRDSVVAGSGGNGIKVVSTAGKAAVTAYIEHSVISGNFGSGINADGANATVRVSDTAVMNNITGVSAANAAAVQSYKNNRISANFTDGTPLTAVPGPGGTPLQ